MNFPIYWSRTTKVSWIQRAILLYSIAYYELDTNIVSDEYYNTLARLLVSEQKKMTREQLLSTEYGKLFEEFTGSSGFDLVHKLDPDHLLYLTNIAAHIVERQKRG